MDDFPGEQSYWVVALCPPGALDSSRGLRLNMALFYTHYDICATWSHNIEYIKNTPTWGISIWLVRIATVSKSLGWAAARATRAVARAAFSRQEVVTLISVLF